VRRCIRPLTARPFSWHGAPLLPRFPVEALGVFHEVLLAGAPGEEVRAILTLAEVETLARRGEEAARSVDAVIAALRGTADLFARYGVTSAVLFGSFAAGRSARDSDVEPLLDDTHEAFHYRTKSELEERASREVDLHTAAERRMFVERVRRTGIVVYGAE
jgi:predicted nucleotidyltransferase